MKFIYCAILACLMAGCAENPIRVRVQSCEYVGNGLYDCTVIPNKDVEPRK